MLEIVVTLYYIMTINIIKLHSYQNDACYNKAITIKFHCLIYHIVKIILI